MNPLFLLQIHLYVGFFSWVLVSVNELKRYPSESWMENQNFCDQLWLAIVFTFWGFLSAFWTFWWFVLEFFHPRGFRDYYRPSLDK